MLLLKNATIYPQTQEQPFIGDVLCEDGKIKQIGKNIEMAGAEILDLTGLNLLPGLVDSHSHAGLGPVGDMGGIAYMPIVRMHRIRLNRKWKLFTARIRQVRYTVMR